MIIQEPDFRMTAVGVFWDLELKKTVKSKSGENSEKWYYAGYGMRLDTCLRLIIRKRMRERQDVYTLKEYFDAYIAEKAAFKETLDKIEEVISEERNKQ